MLWIKKKVFNAYIKSNYTNFINDIELYLFKFQNIGKE